MQRLTLFVFFILFACSKDSPIPDAVVTPIPSVTKFTLTVAASEGGSVNDPGANHNENTNVSVTASPAAGYAFSEWTGDASGSTNPLSVSMTQNKNITANFIRTKYLLNIGTEGEGDVTQEVISTAKTSDEYNSGTLVRLSATPSDNWLFYAWNDGSSGFIDAATGLAEAEELNYTNPRDISINRSLNVTATFERIIEEEDFPANSVGKWKIRKPKNASKANKIVLAECGLSEIIFRTDGSFTIVTSTSTLSGQYNFDGNTTINLTQAQAPFGTITNLLISNGSVSFSISLDSGCSNNSEGNRDKTYVESEDPITGTVSSANCTITSSLDSGSETQIVTQTNSIQDIVYSFSTTCTGSLSSIADNLPPGVTMNFSNNQATLSGAPSSNVSGTYDYIIVVTAPNITTSVNGQINVVSSVIASCTISGQNIGSGQSQTVSLNNAISDITFAVNSSCEENLQAEAIGLPTGVTMNFSDNIAIISGTPTVQTGAYAYNVNWYSSTSSFTLGGTITLVAGSATSTSSTSSSTADTTAPVITLLGSTLIDLTVGDTYSDPGVTAADDIDGDLTSSVTSSGTVDTSMVGFYSVLFSVSDAAGNSALVYREIRVSAAADTIPPVITLTGSSTLNYNVGDAYINVGATASDDIDGDITSSIIFSGDDVDTSSAGTYFRYYNVSDLAGNAASTVTITHIFSAAATTYSISVTASSNSDYTLSGTDINGTVSGDDSSITINAGDTLDFSVNAASHPFYIKTAQGTGMGNQVSNVTNNGATSGVVSWTPAATGTYYYQCSAHDGMYGTITVQ